MSLAKHNGLEPIFNYYEAPNRESGRQLEELLVPDRQPWDHKQRPKVFRCFNPEAYDREAGRDYRREEYPRGESFFHSLPPDVQGDLRLTSSLYATFCFWKPPQAGTVGEELGE